VRTHARIAVGNACPEFAVPKCNAKNPKTVIEVALRRAGALLLIALTLCATMPQDAYATDLARIAVAGWTAGDRVSPDVPGRWQAVLREAIAARSDTALVRPSTRPFSPQTHSRATQAFAEGRYMLEELKLEAAVATLRKAIELWSAEPATIELTSFLEAHISLAAAHLRLGDEKNARSALTAVIVMRPNFVLEAGRFPPVFTRELDKTKTRVNKSTRSTLKLDLSSLEAASIVVDGEEWPKGQTERQVFAGTHHVFVKLQTGAVAVQVVDVKGGSTRVKPAFKEEEPTAAFAQLKVPAVRSNKMLEAETRSKAALYAHQVGAHFVVLGAVERRDANTLNVYTAAYSAERDGFVVLEAREIEDSLEGARAAADSVAAELMTYVREFGNAVALPKSIVPGPAVVLTPVAPSSRGGGAFATAPAATAVQTSSGVDSAEVPWWVWALGGVGVAALAGGTYWGVTQATKPVTGTVAARW
jgi:hypothetical protein